MAPPGLLPRAINNKDNNQPQMVRETMPFIILATLAVVGRYFSRRLRKAPLGIDDYTTLLALVLTWGAFIVILIDIHIGVGKHTEVEPKVNIIKNYKVTYAGSLLYACNITAIKISILLLYKRVFPTPKFILAVRIVGGFVVAWWIVVVIIQIFSCKPVHGFWNINIPSKCINPASFYIAVAVPNILTDVIMLCLPLRMVWRLQMSQIQKVQLSITFLTGAFVIVASLIRIVFLSHADRIDPLWTISGVAIWTSIEPSVGVVCSCLPTMRPLLQETWLAGGNLWTTIRSSPKTIWRYDSHQLSSSTRDTGKASSPHHTKWLDNLSFNSNRNICSETAVTTSRHAPVNESDDVLLMGINVQRDVHVGHFPL